MSPDEVLLAVAAAAAQRGQLCPGLGSDQARHAAQQLLAALQLTTAQPARPRELPPAPRRERLADSPTRLMPTVPAPAPDQFMVGVATPAYRGWS